MLKGLRSAIYPVADPQAAKAWYTELVGHAPYFDSENYVGFEVGGFELGLLKNPNNSSTQGVEVLWGVKNAEATIARLVKLGGEVMNPITDVGGGIKTAAIADPFNNRLGIIENPNFEIADCS